MARWRDKSTGYDCVILRHPEMGVLNGYVGIPKSHRLYGKSPTYEDDDPVDHLYVHGGVTYADTIATLLHHDMKELGAFGEEWYFGFDTGHANDIVPMWEGTAFGDTNHYIAIISHHKGVDTWTYKDFEYVKKQVELLAHQLWEIDQRIGGSNVTTEQT